MTTATPAKSRLADIDLRLLRPSPKNPRKDFSSPKALTALEELADSIRAQGIRQPILARELAGDPVFEIVAGERRFRAAKLAGLSMVPVLVSEMSDREALEVQVVENLQRSDLTELEEAASYQAMLELRDDTTGAPVYTAEALANRFGKERSHVYRRLALLRLIEPARKALEEGHLAARTAVLVARIPSPEAQALAFKAVMSPRTQTEPLSFLAAAELIGREYMQGLKGAPFKLDDADLVPAAGPCATCPKMSDNCAHLYAREEAEAFKKKKVCTDPACYRQKLDAAWARRTEAAKAEGKTVLDEKQSREVFPPSYEAGQMAYFSPYVFLSDKPADHLLKPEVRETVGTWRSLVEAAEKRTAEIAYADQQAIIKEDLDLSKEQKKEALELLKKNPPAGMIVPRVIARDQTGAAREIVERQLAIAAIEASGEPLFIGSFTRMPKAGGDFDAERKRQVEAAKVRLAENIELLSRVHRDLVQQWVESPVWDGLLQVAIDHAAHDGAWLIAKWQGLKYENTGTNLYDVVGAWAAAQSTKERQALVPLLLMSQRLKNSGPGEEIENFASLAGLELDLADVAKKAKAAGKPAKKSKAEKTGKTEEAATYEPIFPTASKVAPEVVEKLLSYDDAAKSLEEMAYLTHLSRDTVVEILHKAGRRREDFGSEPAITLSAQESGGLAPVSFQRTEEEIAADAQVDEINAVEDALDDALAAAIPGCTASARAAILAKYIKRVCKRLKPEAELTVEEKRKIIEILRSATAGRTAPASAKVTTAAEDVE